MPHMGTAGGEARLETLRQVVDDALHLGEGTTFRASMMASRASSRFAMGASSLRASRR